MYAEGVPKLWNETVASHREDVRAAILAAAEALAMERGVTAVTMSDVATRAGIGRATLYKYFTDVRAILVAWHEAKVEAHLALLVAARQKGHGPRDRLATVLETYARIAYEEHGRELVSLLQHGPHVERAYEKLTAVVSDLIEDGVEAGAFRKDVAPSELAAFCLGALSAAPSLPSLAAVKRLVSVTMSGLRR